MFELRKAINLVGMRFGKLEVIGRSADKEREKRSKCAVWICQCECGNVVEYTSIHLRSGDCTNCGCSHSWVDEDGNLHKSSATYSDLTKMRFGRLIVVKRIGTDRNKKPLWECKCDCGNITNVNSPQLSQGHTSSCGCLRREVARDNNMIDITGQKFGRLTALYRNNDTSKWVCSCECGNLTEVPCNTLRCGNTKSCGCLHKDILRSWKGTKHPNWKGRNHISFFLRKCLTDWKNESMKKCGYKCVISGKKFDDIHHLYPVNKITDEVFQVLDFPVYKTIGEYSDEQIKDMQKLFLRLHNKYGLGVCLTHELHVEFHHLYGQIHVTPDNFYEFYFNKTGKKFNEKNFYREAS